VSCGNKKCEREFGFYEDHIAERTMKEIMANLKEEMF